MSDPRDDLGTDRELDLGDAALVRWIAESYRPAEPTPAARVAFRDRLDARTRRRASRRLWMTGAASAAVAVALVLLRGSLPVGAPEPIPIAREPAPDASAEEALLALAVPAASEEEALPADYQAIEDLFLEGEGV